jgi:hypothetical protein
MPTLSSLAHCQVNSVDLPGESQAPMIADEQDSDETDSDDGDNASEANKKPSGGRPKGSTAAAKRNEKLRIELATQEAAKRLAELREKKQGKEQEM